MVEGMEEAGEVKLLPCPFCGGTRVYETMTVVICNHCDAQGPDVLSRQETAADLWNTRRPLRDFAHG